MKAWTKEELLAATATAENNLRVRYDAGETGWVTALGDGFYVINNQPLCDHLCFLDVVTLANGDTHDIHPLHHVERVVQRVLTHKTVIYYHKASWHKLRTALRAGGMYVEGWTAGTCCVAHTEAASPRATLVASGLDVDKMRFERKEVGYDA